VLKSIVSVAIFAAAMAGVPVAAQAAEAGGLVVEKAYAVETAPSAKSGAGYLSITNNGEAADRLVEVRGDFPAVQLHMSQMHGDVAHMMPVASVEIAPGQTITMEPGGMHVMFMGLEEPFEAGDTVSATLVFEEAGEVEVSFPVKARDASGHSH
jgi:periplasmic copper chaperone A